MFSPLQKEEKKPRNLKFILAILGIILVVFFVLLRPVWAVYRHANNGKKFVAKAEEELLEGDFKEMALYLSFAHKDFLKAQKNMKGLRWYKGVPLLGKQVLALDSLLLSACDLTGSLDSLAQVFSDMLVPLGNDGQKGEALRIFGESTSLLRETRGKLDSANSRLEDYPVSGLLPQIRNTFTMLQDKMPFLVEKVDQLIIASEILPEVMGYPEEKTYLFLFQNNMELRPSGGFIGTYGILKFANGEITSFFTDDTYNLDVNFEGKIPTPEPFLIYNKREDWYFRDSNWSPDFSEAAQKAEWFYHLEGGEEELDGVIAITPSLIEYILELTGSIEIEGYPYEFTSENFSDQLEFHVEQNFYKFEEKKYRKSIIGDLGEILMTRVFSLPRGQMLSLFNIVSRGFSEKQAFIYLDDANLQKIIGDLNWDGRVKETAGDYFLYVDCNLASLKSDPFVLRTIDYAANWDGEGQPIASLTMHYNHIGEFDWRTTRYRTYVRLYVPQGSELIKISGNESEIKVYEELGKTVFAFFKVTEPGTSEEVTIEYYLPEYLAKTPYSLYAQKQGGTFDHDFNLEIDWNGVSREVETDLKQDREFQF